MTNAFWLERIHAIRDRLPDLKTVISVDASDDKADVISFGSLVERTTQFRRAADRRTSRR